MITLYSLLCVFTSCIALGITPVIIYDAVTYEMTTRRLITTVCLSVIAIASLGVAIASFRKHRTIVRNIATIYAEPNSTPSDNTGSLIV